MKNKWHISKSKKLVCGEEKNSWKIKSIPYTKVGVLDLDKICTKCLDIAPKPPKSLFKIY